MCERSKPRPYVSLFLAVHAEDFLGGHECPRRDTHGRCSLIALFCWALSPTQMRSEPLLCFQDFGVPACCGLQPFDHVISSDVTLSTPIKPAVSELKDERWPFGSQATFALGEHAPCRGRLARPSAFTLGQWLFTHEEDRTRGRREVDAPQATLHGPGLEMLGEMTHTHDGAIILLGHENQFGEERTHFIGTVHVSFGAEIGLQRVNDH